MALAQSTSEGKEQRSGLHSTPLGREITRQVHADQGSPRKIVRRFLQRFTHDRLGQCFSLFQMAGRLIEAQAIGGLLLNHQKTTLVLDNGGNSDRGFPNVSHDNPYKSRHFTVAGLRFQAAVRMRAYLWRNAALLARWIIHSN